MGLTHYAILSTIFVVLVTASLWHNLVTNTFSLYLLLFQILGFLLALLIVYFPSKRMENRVLSAVEAVREERNRSREHERVLKSVIKNLPCALSVISSEFTVLQTNPELTRITGVASEKIIGQKCYDVYGEGKVCTNCATERAFRTGQVQKNIKREITRTDKEIYIEQTAIPIKRSDGTIKYVWEVITDITEHKELEEEYKKMFIEMIAAFVALIDSRDVYTGAHSMRVKQIAVAIARHMGLSDSMVSLVSTAAMLHDIGKIGIPEAILNKPEKLTDEEFEIIKRHPQIGYDTLKNIKPLADIAEAVRYHHERFDGKGYPGIKQGADIPLIARILTVADVYEALTADRVYRKAMTVDDALLIMYSGKQTYFDPQVLENFFQVLMTQDEGLKGIISALPSRYHSVTSKV